MQRISTAVFFLVVYLSTAPQASAQNTASGLAPPVDDSENFSVETVLSGLDNPAGLVLRAGNAKAGPHELFLAESGAGRIVRIATDQPKETSEVITGFSQNSFGDQPSLQLGPVSLAFLTRSKLVVGGAAQQSSQGVASVYLLPNDGSTVAADKFDHTAGPIHAGDSSTGSKNVFFGIAETGTALFITWGDQDKGWILKSGIEANNRLAYLQPFVTPKQTSDLGAPTGIAINPSPRPPFLVVAHRGSVETPRDSTISFYVPSSAASAMNLDTGLHDIFSLAYSPTSQLYAADFAWKEKESGGVYRLDDAYVNGQQTCQAVKIASIPRPTALAFTPDGALYVTALGAGAKQGVLLKITGGL